MDQSTIDQQQAEYIAAAEQHLKEQTPVLDGASAIGQRLMAEFKQAEQSRRLIEERWLKDLRQFKGIYDPEVLALIGANRSRAFVRKTRVKVKTVNSKIEDLLFPSNSGKNWSIDPTPVPSISDEDRAKVAQVLAQQMGGNQQPTKDQIDEAVRKGVDMAAKAMEKHIDDQLVEARYKAVAKKVLHSGHLYGTGILKAPLVERKVRTRFIKEAVQGTPGVKSGYRWKVVNEEYITPFVDFVPVWRFYPDMAATDIDSCRFVYERHLLTKQAMLDLARRKSFDSLALRNYVAANPDGHMEARYIDTELRAVGERLNTALVNSGHYEIIERWGWLDGKELSETGMVPGGVPEERMGEMFFTNVWMLTDGRIVKLALQPINGVTWPYHLYYFDQDETSIFGEGIPSVMRDDQQMINASVRMMLDNAALTAGPQIEVNVSMLAPTEKATEQFPFKVWPRTDIANASSPALRVLDMPSHLGDLQAITNMFEANGDEVTGVPRYMYGENATTGAAGTASGLSMLMGNQTILMKDLVINYDDGITEPFMTAMYRWNMQFNDDDDCKGDFDVNVLGAASLVAKEVRGQMLDQFAAQTSNPMDAPYVKRDALLRQRADAHDLRDVVKTEDEVAAEQQSPQAQAAQQLAQTQQQLQMATLQATLAKLQAQVADLQAATSVKNAEAMAKRVGAAYSAMQAGGVAVSNAHIAPAGDAILQDAGWISANQAQPGQPQGAGPVPDQAAADANGQPMQPSQVPGDQQPPSPQPPQAQADQSTVPQPAGPNQGMQQGIETARIDATQPQVGQQ